VLAEAQIPRQGLGEAQTAAWTSRQAHEMAGGLVRRAGEVDESCGGRSP